MHVTRTHSTLPPPSNHKPPGDHPPTPGSGEPNFTVGDFNKAFEFDDESFDAVYAIQPMTYVSDHAHTFSEVFRVLKPGGRFVINDVAALDAYDRDNPHHKTLIQHTRELTVFGGFWHYEYWEDAYHDAGFELISSVGRPAVGRRVPPVGARSGR